MLATIGAASVDDLFQDVPAEAVLDGPIAGLPNHASEMAVERALVKMAGKNLTANTLRGRIQRAQFRVCKLQSLQLRKQAVVFRIRDLRRIQRVVKLCVMLKQAAQCMRFLGSRWRRKKIAGRDVGCGN